MNDSPNPTNLVYGLQQKMCLIRQLLQNEGFHLVEYAIRLHISLSQSINYCYESIEFMQAFHLILGGDLAIMQALFMALTGLC